MDYGYEGTAVFPFTLSPSQQLALGDAKLVEAVYQPMLYSRAARIMALMCYPNS
jgi:hypothetical protein